MIEIDKAKQRVKLEFRKGLYFEEAIEKALETVPKEIKCSKAEEGDFFVVELLPKNRVSLEELAGWFSNTVIALSKESPC